MLQAWSLLLRTYSVSNTIYKGIYRISEFNAVSNEEAKSKVLKLTKLLAKRLRRNDVCIYAQAMPYKVRDGRRILNANLMLRNKHSYSDKKILEVTNPDIAFVQGYGPKIHAKIQE